MWRSYKLTNVSFCCSTQKSSELTKKIRENCAKTMYLLGALALQLHGNGKLGEETSKLFTLFLEINRTNPASFQGVCMNDILFVEDLVQVNIFLYDVDFVDGAMIGELARRSVGKHSNTVGLLRYNSPIRYVFDINEHFKAYRCPSCDTFNTAPNLERHLTTFSDRVKHVYPKNVYHLRETLFDKLDSFGIPYTDTQILFNNIAIFFHFESICVEDENFKDTETTTYNGKYISIKVPISSNLITEPIFLCNHPNLRHLVSSFIDALDNLTTKKSSNEKNFL